MLVLSRHKDEQIVINPGQWDEVVIVVVETRSDRVRLGILAAPEVVVNRREVQEKIDRESARKAGA